MKKSKRVVITKCYLVQVVNEEGNELKHEYVFGDRKEAAKVGQELKKGGETEWI